MKRIITFILVLLLLISAVACNASDSSETTDGDAVTTEDPAGTNAGDETTKKPFDPLEDGTLMEGSEGAYWKINGTKLTFFGEGAFISMAAGFYPWNKYKDEIESVEVSTGVTYLGTYACNGMKALKTVRIEDSSVTDLGMGCFAFATNLESVTLGDALLSIPTECFIDCSSLRTISVPSSLTSIGNNAFLNCTSLESIYYEGSRSEWEAITVGFGNEALLSATVYCTVEE